MVVFDTVSAQLSTELCLAIPGDFIAKLAYLQQELKEHYPHVVVTHADNHLKVHGHLQEIVDLHSVLDVWFSTRDRSKQNETVAIQSENFGSSSLPSTLPAALPNPLAVSSAPYNIQYVTSNPETAVQLNTSVSASVIGPERSEEMSPQVPSHIAVLPYPSGADVREQPVPPSSVEASTCTESDQNIAAVNTSFTSSTDEVMNDVESQNIKSFIKSWSNRKKNQEVQTDLPEIAPSPNSSGRRRKPGTPRKAKAHIPLKTEQPVKVMKSRAKKRPSRFSDDEKASKKRVGRPPKKFSLDKVLPEEMIPIESNLADAPAAPDKIIDEVGDGETNTEKENEQWALEVENGDEEEEGEGTSEVAMEVQLTVPGDIVTGGRAAKMEALHKVSELAREEGVEVKQERRGRKHKDWPCIAREAIEDILPSPELVNVGCTLCPQVCKTRASLKQHYLRCHLERRFQCMVCGKRYGMLKELASHKLTHNRRHQCPSCDKKFATQFLLDGHVERRHLNPKIKLNQDAEDQITSMMCPHCDFEAKTKKSLRDHIIRKHGEKRYQCPVCNKKFAMGKDLNQHVKFHSEVFQCDECGKALKSKLALKLHVNGIHRGIKLSKEKEYVCEDCGKICRNKTHFKEHVNKVHLQVKPFICDVCSTGFYTKHGLKCHSYTHSDVREFICDLCAKAFKSRSGLRVHRITHRDKTARPYACSTCSKTFTQRGALVRHERIHSGDRPYKCRLCEASFNDYSILRRHVVGVHKIDDRALCGRGNIDPNCTNRGRPKVPGPVQHNLPCETFTEAPPVEQSEVLAKTVPQVISEAPERSVAPPIEASTDAHYALVEPAQRLYQLSTPGDDHSYSEMSTKVLREHPIITTSTSSHMQMENAQPEEAVQLIQLADLSPSQLMQQHHQILHQQQQQQQQQQHQQQQQQQQQQQHHTMNVMPVSVVNDIVHNALYEHHLDSGGSYTIGMPVFPTPTTVGSMHMMQPVQPLAHLQQAIPSHQQQQEQQQQQQQQHLDHSTAPH